MPLVQRCGKRQHPPIRMLLTTDGNADDTVFSTLASFFNNKEIADLTFTIALTSTWNRLNKAFRTTPGTYRVGQFA